MTELKDWLNSINFTKQNLIEEDPDAISKYPPYIVNRCLSGHLDCIMFANEMNKFPNLIRRNIVYLNTLRKKKDSLPGSVRIKSRILKSSNNTMVIVTKKHSS